MPFVASIFTWYILLEKNYEAAKEQFDASQESDA